MSSCRCVCACVHACVRVHECVHECVRVHECVHECVRVRASFSVGCFESSFLRSGIFLFPLFVSLASLRNFSNDAFGSWPAR